MAKIKESDIDALRERADIVEIVSNYTQLKKSGGSTFKGLCPFHAEKTPSFQVNVGSGLFHCFGCQQGGNIYQFVMEVESLPFPEAVEWVARKVGFQLHYEDQRPGEQQRSGQKARLIAANKTATEFFHKTLMDSPDALAARRYMEGRGFDKEVAERWQLGYAPGRDALCKLLLQKGFKREEIVAADLGKISERDGSLYDSFRQRIIFPTWSIQGDVVGFGARAMGDQQPKYLNTAETPVFAKSRIMYGLNRAKSSIARSYALVVEGYTDVIALHEAGIEQAVATNGVALGETHFELLKKWATRIVLMFDADAAGMGAAERGWGVEADLRQMPLAHRIGLEVLVAPLPVGRDPAEVVKEDGAEGINKVVDAAQPLLQFKLDQTIAKLPLDTPESRARAGREVVKVLGWHPDPIARHQYTFAVARRIGIEPEGVQRALSDEQSYAPGVGGGRDQNERVRRVPGHIKVEKEALTLLLSEDKEATSSIGELADELFTGTRRELFVRIREARAKGNSVDARITEDLSPEASTLFTELAMGTHPATPEEGAESGAREVFGRLRLFILEREIKVRRNTLQDLNPLDDAERHDALFTELVGLEAKRRDLLRSIQGAA
ncbi:MAG TPA: DNA primase [Actinomycetota bacterium]|nr:DNA primase [Actinomycetota bacterium]